jgi:hypothetical protein
VSVRACGCYAGEMRVNSVMLREVSEVLIGGVLSHLRKWTRGTDCTMVVFTYQPGNQNRGFR